MFHLSAYSSLLKLPRTFQSMIARVDSKRVINVRMREREHEHEREHEREYEHER